jgi:putative two-component system response regulator
MDERFRSGESVMVDEIKSVLCVPVESAEEILGAIYIDTVSHIRRYGKSDLELLSALGRQAGLAIKREIGKEEKELLFTDTIRAVIAAIEAKDRYLAGHSLRVSEYAEKLAYSLGYNSRFVDRLKYAAHLHDVGKIGTPEAILNKPDRLTEEEYEIIKEHPGTGADILENIRDIEDVVLAVRHHHERMDGKGYPDGLVGQNIPIMGRAIAVVDAFDAMTSDRAYRPAPGVEVAVSEFRRTAGTQFDPVFVEKMLELIQSGQIAPPKR